MIYFAPSTGGTFHVHAAQFVSYSKSVTGTAVVTVTP
jgi:hypothetical protein